MAGQTSRIAQTLPADSCVQPFPGVSSLADIRVLVVVSDDLERESICILLASWGCKAEGTGRMESLPPLAPDVLIVAVPGESEIIGAAVIAHLRAQYDRRMPAILATEVTHSRHATDRPGYMLLEPGFTAARLYAALSGLVRGI